jgi:hypothetical protein
MEVRMNVEWAIKKARSYFPTATGFNGEVSLKILFTRKMNRRVVMNINGTGINCDD